MGSVPKQGARRPPVLSDRQRYVARARYLIEHPPFAVAIVGARAEWDVTHPVFAIGRPAPPPVPPPFPIPDGPAAPPKLVAAAKAYNHALANATATEEEQTALVYRGEDGWRDLLGRLCAAWWPPRWYPIAPGPMTHPARRFVSGCLLWGTEHAREAWIAWPALHPVRLSAPVEEMASPAEVVYWRTQAESLHRGMTEAARDGVPLTKAAVAALARAAHAEGWEARQATEAALRAEVMPGWVGGVVCVPLHPGMTHEDWRGAETAALDSVRERDRQPLLRAEARRLHAEGGSGREIAGRLGLSRSTVRAWTQGD